jgi:hypothetical protein
MSGDQFRKCKCSAVQWPTAATKLKFRRTAQMKTIWNSVCLLIEIYRNVLYCVVPSICCSCSLVTRTSRAQRAQVLLKHSDVPFAEAILSCARLLLAKALLDPIRLVLMILTWHIVTHCDTMWSIPRKTLPHGKPPGLGSSRVIQRLPASSSILMYSYVFNKLLINSIYSHDWEDHMSTSTHRITLNHTRNNPKLLTPWIPAVAYFCSSLVDYSACFDPLYLIERETRQLFMVIDLPVSLHSFSLQFSCTVGSNDFMKYIRTYKWLLWSFM